MDVFEKHMMDDISIIGNHALLQFTDIVMDSLNAVWNAEQCWSMFSLSLYAGRKAKITAIENILNRILTPNHRTTLDNGIPIVSSVSFRFPAAPVESESCTFKLHLSNIELLNGTWSISTMPPNSWKRYLQPKATSRARNNEAFPEYKEGRFSQNYDSLLSHLWGTEFDFKPSQTNNKGNFTFNNPKDLSLYEISPTTGSLRSKESTVIKIKYSYSTKGKHDVSVLLRIYPAVFVWIHLIGTTLDSRESCIQLMHGSQMILHPVCLSNLDPPMQMFWLYNGGNSATTFSVDMEPFKKLKNDNFGHGVIECITPNGVVQPRTWCPIQLRFSPLEYTDYEAELIIYPGYSVLTPLKVLVIGTAAIHPTQCLRPAATSETVQKFVLFAQEVPITLSPSHISINHFIPTGQTVSRMVFLTNLHARNTMKFYWKNVPIEGGGLISFHPNCGRLGPKQEVSCKIKIRAGNTSTVFSTMIACTIEDETALSLYEFVLNEWNDLNRHYETHMQVTTGPVPTNHRRLRKKAENEIHNTPKPEKPEAYKRLLAVSMYIGTVLGQFDDLSVKEKSRLGFVDVVNCKCARAEEDRERTTQLSRFPFTHTGSQLCQQIIRDMIWDMVQTNNFGSFLRDANKKNAPLFEEYLEVECENDEKNLPATASNKELATLPVKNTSEILEISIFNIMHEMAERFARAPTADKWYELPPVQPKPLVDVEKYKELFK